MEIPLFSNQDFDNYLLPFKRFFNQPQLSNFTQYLLGLLLCEGKRTITHLHEADSRRGSYNRLHHFLTESPWSEESLQKHRIDLSIKEIEEDFKSSKVKVGFIIGDDTTNPKCGRKMPGFGWNYCSTEEQPIKSQCIVTNLYHYNGNDYPLQMSLYKHQESFKENLEAFQTKNQLMIKHLEKLSFPEEIRTIGLFDSLYFNNDIISACSQKNIDSIGVLRCNRRAILQEDDPVGCRLDNWFRYLKSQQKHPFKQITIRDSKGAKQQTWMFHWTGVIKNLGEVQLIMLTPRLRGKKVEPLFIATTAMDLSVEEIIEYYFTRWKIETFFWTIKQHLGFNHYQVRSETATIRHWYLVLMAYSFLVKARKKSDPSATLGVIKKTFQRQNFKIFIDHIHDNIKKYGQSSNATYLKFAA